MKNNPVLLRAVEAVVFLFAAFSGFLNGIAPPEDIAEFSAGMGSALALCVLLLISTWMKRRPKRWVRRLWLAAAGALMIVAVITGLFYRYNLDRLTFAYPPDNPKSRYIAGTRYTPEASTLVDRQGLSPGQVVAKFGGLANRHLVWPLRDVERARIILVTNYILFALSLGCTVFSLVVMKASSQISSESE